MRLCFFVVLTLNCRVNRTSPIDFSRDGLNFHHLFLTLFGSSSSFNKISTSPKIISSELCMIVLASHTRMQIVLLYSGTSLFNNDYCQYIDKLLQFLNQEIIMRFCFRSYNNLTIDIQRRGNQEKCHALVASAQFQT